MTEIDLIIRKLNKQLTADEETIFNAWLNELASNKRFYNHIRALQGKGKDISNLSAVNIDDAWNVVLRKQAAKNLNVNKSFNFKSFLKYAAILIGIAGIVFIIHTNFNSLNNTELQISKDDITLQLEDGTVEIIKSGEVKNVINLKGEIIGQQKGKALHYKPIKKIETLVYNELNIPHGRELTLYLSDGTKVELNSGTKFKYPINFIKGKSRKVFLNGEAYFEVTKDSLHPFIVDAKEMDIQVLGTSFNVSAYDEELNMSTVLIEGSVQVRSKVLNKLIVLEPGYMASLTGESDLNVSKVDVSKYTAWMEGAIVFIDLDFSDVVKKLERKYSVEIVNNYDKLNLEKYTGRFDSESILDIVKSFQFDIPFEYKIKGNTITIYEPNDD
jgi:ferric-dicitrate binding protein FerR (iron transport regulator)